ncbi:hypothetical protein [Paenibacillus polysaccharolyticus]|uniref:hypothetical protein n=1 Tax=Paenibacillus polysaccharolyticus TaxID=582692 RepID=UPI00300A1BE1
MEKESKKIAKSVAKRIAKRIRKRYQEEGKNAFTAATMSGWKAFFSAYISVCNRYPRTLSNKCGGPG